MQTIVTPLLESAIFLPRKASAPHGMKFIQNTPQVQSLQSCGCGTGKTTCATGDIWIFYCSQAHSWTIKLARSVIEITAIETSDTSLCIHPLNRMAATKFTHGAIYKTPFFTTTLASLYRFLPHFGCEFTRLLLFYCPLLSVNFYFCTTLVWPFHTLKFSGM